VYNKPTSVEGLFKMQTTCIRCGKVRISFKKWEDRSLKGPAITHEKTVCPDAECQKLVDRKFEEIREKKEALRNAKNLVQN